jgi:hypothetical protein
MASVSGLQILGTFGTGSIGTVESGAGLVEAVFFHEQPCYEGGREYGISFDRAANTFQAYWGTSVNCTSSQCSGSNQVEQSVPLSMSYVGGQYYFSIWPNWDGSSCNFTVQIQAPAPSNQVLYQTTTADVSSALLNADPTFCNAITSDTGYVTASTQYTPTITSIDTTHNVLTLNQINISHNPILNGTYTLHDMSSGKALDNGSSDIEDSPVMLWGSKTGTSQQWVITNAGGFYTLTSAYSGYLLDDGGYSLNLGNGMVQWPSDGGQNQQWAIVSLGNNYYNLVNRYSGLALDDGGTPYSDGQQVTQWAPYNGTNQMWQITSNYTQNLAKTSAWLASQQLTDGAIMYTPAQIEPYFANLAAIGMLSDSTRIPQVEAWMQWYIGHFNWPDYNGLYGTVYDYNISNGVEVNTDTYNSVDSYAATFLTLAEALWDTGNPGAQAFIRSIGEYDFIVVGNLLLKMQQSNGLLIAQPDYPVEYLEDDCEDYRGMMDFANLATQAWGDTFTTTLFQTQADTLQSAIQNILYIPASGLYYAYEGAAAPNLGTWFPDSVSQVFPITNGVIAPASSQAKGVYSKFNAAWPGWPQLNHNGQDLFPWALVGYAGYLMGDTANTNAYINTIQNQYVNVTPDFPWYFFDAEGGWFMRTNAGMQSVLP